MSANLLISLFFLFLAFLVYKLTNSNAVQAPPKNLKIIFKRRDGAEFPLTIDRDEDLESYFDRKEDAIEDFLRNENTNIEPEIYAITHKNQKISDVNAIASAAEQNEIKKIIVKCY